MIATTPDIREWLSNEKYPHIYEISRAPHPALALFAVKAAAREAAAKAKADQQVPPPSQKAYVEDLSRLPEGQRLNALEILAKDVESLNIKLSVASVAPSLTSPAK